MFKDSYFKSAHLTSDSSCSVTTNDTHLVFEDITFPNLKMITTFQSQLQSIVYDVLQQQFILPLLNAIRSSTSSHGANGGFPMKFL